MTDISVIIVNWNSGDYLFNCVSSVLEFSGRLSVEVVVVDNCSDDNSLEKIQELSSVKVIVNDSNLGFSRACNIGAFNATGSFLLFLNPDALVFEGTLDTVFSFMTDPSNARVGICGTQLLNEVGKNREVLFKVSVA